MDAGKRGLLSWLVALGVAGSCFFSVALPGALAQPAATTAIWTGEWSVRAPIGTLRLVQRSNFQVEGQWVGVHGLTRLTGTASGTVLNYTWTAADGTRGSGQLAQSQDRKSAHGVMKQAGVADVNFGAARTSTAVPVLVPSARPAALAPAKPRGPLPLPDCALVPVLPVCANGDPGECHAKIKHVRYSERNLPAAFCMAQSACQRGHGESCRTAAYMLNDYDFAKDELRAAELNEAGCRGGDGTSCMAASWRHSPKKTDLPDSEAHKLARRKVVEYHLRACTLGPADVCRALGSAYEAGKLDADQDALATPLLDKACADKQVQACTARTGRKAIDALEATCKKTKGAAACTEAADAYEYGHPVGKDPARAKALLEAGCNGGDCACCFRRSRAADGAAWVTKGAVYCEKACAAAGANSAQDDHGHNVCRAATDLLLGGKRTAATDKRAAGLLKARCAAGGEHCEQLAVLALASALPAADIESALVALDARCERARGKYGYDLSCGIREKRQTFMALSAQCSGRKTSGCIGAAESLTGVGDGPGALRLLDGACRGGEPAACVVASGLLRLGMHGAPVDPNRAQVLRQQGETACASGHGRACKELAALYRATSGAPTEKAKQTALLGQALVAFERGCSANAPADCFEAGVAHRSGFGVPTDWSKAALLLEKACTLAHAEACRLAGWQYAQGHASLAKDPARAAALYEPGCRLGDVSACGHLRGALDHGRVAPARTSEVTALLAGQCQKKITGACPRPPEAPQVEPAPKPAAAQGVEEDWEEEDDAEDPSPPAAAPAVSVPAEVSDTKRKATEAR